MKLFIGSARELPFVVLTFSWILLMELAHQYYLAPENSYMKYASLVILVFTIYNYLMSCFKEPGIVPNSNLTEEQALASIQDIIKFEGMNT